MYTDRDALQNITKRQVVRLLTFFPILSDVNFPIRRQGLIDIAPRCGRRIRRNGSGWGGNLRRSCVRGSPWAPYRSMGGLNTAAACWIYPPHRPIPLRCLVDRVTVVWEKQGNSDVRDGRNSLTPPPRGFSPPYSAVVICPPMPVIANCLPQY